jgi:hypothetical protein
MFGRIGCLFGRHQRSKGQAREAAHTYVSVCRYCGIPMERGWDRDRRWRVARTPPPETGDRGDAQ